MEDRSRIEQAEEFELKPTNATAGPSRRPPGTWHVAPSNSVLFDVNPTASSSPRHTHQMSSTMDSPRHTRQMSVTMDSPSTPKRSYREHFLEEEGIRVPDLSGMLGLDDKDRFAVAAAMNSTSRRRLYLLMEEPSSSREAFYVHVSVTAIILFSAVMTTLSTMPSFHTNPFMAKALFALDIFLVLIFTVEFSARFYAHCDSWSQFRTWALAFLTWIDLLAILPFYVELALRADTSVEFKWSILRVFRLLRVFRSFHHESQLLLTIEVMYLAIRKSGAALLALSFFILLVLAIASTLLFFAERGEWNSELGLFVDEMGDPSQFSSIPLAAWFALTTISTNGYGDMVPVTTLGKLITVPLLVFGLLLIALPSFVLGRNFALIFDSLASSQAATAPPSARSSVEIPMMTTDTPPAGSGRRMAPQVQSTATALGAEDISNTKLAKNQLVLLEQIEALRRTIDRQGAMLQALMKATVPSVPNGDPFPHTTDPPIPARTRRSEEQFDLGSDSEDEGLKV